MLRICLEHFIIKKTCGAESDVSIFSFQAVKNLPSADAGIINFKDRKLLNLAKNSAGVE